MSEIKFIQAFGDALDRAIAADTTRQRQPQRPSIWARLRRLARSHRPLAIILVAVTVAGCTAATIALTANKQETTVAYGISCMRGTRAIEPDLQVSPTQMVAGAFGTDAVRLCATTFAISSSRLIACVRPNKGIFVYAREKFGDSCAAHGLVPYSKQYVDAVASVASLDAALESLYDSRDCWSRDGLMNATAKVLSQHHFYGWRPVFRYGVTQDDPDGPCYAYPALPQIPDTPQTAPLLLDPATHTVQITRTSSRSATLATIKVQAAALSEPRTPVQIMAIAHRVLKSMHLDGRMRVSLEVYTDGAQVTTTTHFSHWRYEHSKYWLSNYWLANDGRTIVFLGGFNGKLWP